MQVAAGFGEPDDGRGPRGAGRDLVEHLDRLRDERGPQQEILGRVPGDRQLGEHDEIATGGLGRVVRLEDALRVAFEIADDDVQLGGGHPKARHVPGYEGPAGCATLGTDDAAGRATTYQRRFDELASSGVDVHGEAAFVMRCAPGSVLDAGCGTGRVAIELARRGVEVVGVDVDASMLATARANGPGVEWHEHDLTTLDLGPHVRRRAARRQRPAVHRAGHAAARWSPAAPGTLRADGVLVAGFQLGRGYDIDAYDADCAAAGLVLAERFSTWAGDPYRPGDDYAVSVHRFADR